MFGIFRAVNALLPDRPGKGTIDGAKLGRGLRVVYRGNPLILFSGTPDEFLVIQLLAAVKGARKGAGRELLLETPRGCSFNRTT